MLLAALRPAAVTVLLRCTPRSLWKAWNINARRTGRISFSQGAQHPRCLRLRWGIILRCVIQLKRLVRIVRRNRKVSVALAGRNGFCSFRRQVRGAAAERHQNGSEVTRLLYLHLQSPLCYAGNDRKRLIFSQVCHSLGNRLTAVFSEEPCLLPLAVRPCYSCRNHTHVLKGLTARREA